ncbi:peptidoglycan-recognition protein SB1 [Cephus cinctus]|uniref:Peptidoglycan-recognition protein SB1 n=1 Tax=Cephus cinctus TaxID=211228 RepID=A0AAJ7W5D2_CEPCN|nr:peptidoglycan-recognition protein SB1 [Cephus cinctus]XP_015604365.1 peptidoglycan-recognition protein SB1 [Cephus cinctus]XP_015604366.1 peptidoglycan-recognition protein SB1 [Cephus cinctus]XP_015604367.1 peptidoglycan-recognition protein SB1 [Cephus cinctus]XP_024945170.1 peptidoglycan-recognition protein SB1 [Cephus cinctus]
MSEVTENTIRPIANYEEICLDEVPSENETDDENDSENNGIPVVDVSHGTIIVNMENTSNVEVKPTTQFYAPVTIHQYLNGHPPSSQSRSHPKLPISTNSNNLQEESNSSSKAKLSENADSENTTGNIDSNVSCSKTSNSYWKTAYVVIFLATLIVCAIVLYWTLSDPLPNDSSSSSWIKDESDYALGNGFNIFTRNRWGGRPIINESSRPLAHPVPYVIIGHTASNYCDTVSDCSSLLQTIQGRHVSELEFIDIGYNFLLDGCGNIYQALGWDIRNYIRNNSIMISVIGNFIYDKVNDKHRDAVQALIKRGIERKKISPNYRLIGHNQTSATDSPGKNLAITIKNWPHYYDGPIV